MCTLDKLYAIFGEDMHYIVKVLAKNGIAVNPIAIAKLDVAPLKDENIFNVIKDIKEDEIWVEQEMTASIWEL